MPKKLYGHRLLEIRGDVFLFGGKDNFGSNNLAVYQLACSSMICSWSTINQALKVERYSAVVIPVSDTFCF